MKKIQKLGIFSFIILALIFIISFIIINQNSYIAELTQLSNQTERQMMGYILKTKENKLIIIDGGTDEDAENLKKYINENNMKVDYWFLTHVHDDHVGAFVKIIEDMDIKIDNIIVALNNIEWYEQNEPERIEFTNKFFNTLQNDKIKENIKQVEMNQILEIEKNITAEIIGIQNPEIIDNCGNEQSIIIKFYLGNTSFLVLGDAGVETSKKLLENQKDKLKSDIVQMSHHGQNGAIYELYEQIKPKICMWPTPEWLWNNDSGNGYNSGTWKTLEVRKWMEELGAEKNIVEKDGDITIKVK